MSYTRINNDWNDITGKPTNLATLPVDWGDLINIPADIAFLPVFEDWQSISFTTINNIFTNVWSINVGLNEVVSYEIDLLGRRQGTNGIWSAKYVNAVVNNAGILTQIGLLQNFLRENLTTNAQFQSTNVGTTHFFRVHSGTIQVINWIGKIRIFKTTLP